MDAFGFFLFVRSLFGNDPFRSFFLLAQKRIMMSFVLKIIVNFEKSAVQETNYLFKNMFQKIVRSKQTIVLFKSFGFFSFSKKTFIFSRSFEQFQIVPFCCFFVRFSKTMVFHFLWAIKVNHPLFNFFLNDTTFLKIFVRSQKDAHL